MPGFVNEILSNVTEPSAAFVFDCEASGIAGEFGPATILKVNSPLASVCSPLTTLFAFNVTSTGSIAV